MRTKDVAMTTIVKPGVSILSAQIGINLKVVHILLLYGRILNLRSDYLIIHIV